MKTLRLKAKESNTFLDSDIKNKEFYLFRDGLFLIGETDKETKEYLVHPVITQMFEFFDHEVVDAISVKEMLEGGEWEIVDFSKRAPFTFFDLIYATGE